MLEILKEQQDDEQGLECGRGGHSEGPVEGTSSEGLKQRSDRPDLRLKGALWLPRGDGPGRQWGLKSRGGKMIEGFCTNASKMW